MELEDIMLSKVGQAYKTTCTCSFMGAEKVDVIEEGRTVVTRGEEREGEIG
jgi:hypothetical protein